MTFSQLLAAIIAALIIGATVITGLTAVENGVNSMKNSRKETANEYCYAKVESMKPRSDFEKESYQTQCIAAENDKIDANFAKTLGYITCFKSIVPTASGSSATAQEIISAAGLTCSL